MTTDADRERLIRRAVAKARAAGLVITDGNAAAGMWSHLDTKLGPCGCALSALAIDVASPMQIATMMSKGLKAYALGALNVSGEWIDSFTLGFDALDRMRLDRSAAHALGARLRVELLGEGTVAQ